MRKSSLQRVECSAIFVVIVIIINIIIKEYKYYS